MGKFIGWAKQVLSEKDGTPSASRVLMFIFSFFTMAVIVTILHHVYYMTDVNRVGLWLNAFPYILFALASLIVLPYTVNSGRGGLGDIAQIIGQMKQGGSIIASAQNAVSGNPNPPAPAPTGAVGGAGDKG